METRVEFNAMLKAVCPNVYFQPPETVKLVYPCIIYALDNDQVSYANDRIYKQKDRYTVTLIDKNPDSGNARALRGFPYCSFDRTYKSENLYHYIYTIFY